MPLYKLSAVISNDEYAFTVFANDEKDAKSQLSMIFTYIAEGYELADKLNDVMNTRGVQLAYKLYQPGAYNSDFWLEAQATLGLTSSVHIRFKAASMDDFVISAVDEEDLDIIAAMVNDKNRFGVAKINANHILSEINDIPYMLYRKSSILAVISALHRNIDDYVKTTKSVRLDMITAINEDGFDKAAKTLGRSKKFDAVALAFTRCDLDDAQLPETSMLLFGMSKQNPITPPAAHVAKNQP
jgi:hypothetical protein